MITVNDLKKSYGSQAVLQGISLTQSRGEAVVIIGPSGCGKSTFLRCLNQLETIDAGQITIAGITFEAEDARGARPGNAVNGLCERPELSWPVLCLCTRAMHRVPSRCI